LLLSCCFRVFDAARSAAYARRRRRRSADHYHGRRKRAALPLIDAFRQLPGFAFISLPLMPPLLSLMPLVFAIFDDLFRFHYAVFVTTLPLFDVFQLMPFSRIAATDFERRDAGLR
jgi:hypothetical protein